jgi:hypothetical protein
VKSTLFGGVMLVGRIIDGNGKAKYLCMTWGRSETETMRSKFIRVRHGGYLDLL